MTERTEDLTQDTSTVMRGTATLLLSTAPERPVPPKFPRGLDWQYSEELKRYTLDEGGVDRLLDFRDNLYGTEDSRGYIYDMVTWEMQMNIIYDRIRELGL